VQIEHSHKRPSIYIADDDTDDVFFVERAIRQLDLDINLRHFINGRDLLRELESKHDELPNVIVLDLNMPIMDGKETLRNIRKNGELRSLPVVILSTSTFGGEKEACLVSGANNYFVKPYSFARYLEIFQQVKAEWIDTVSA
jgi:two-component system response regulator